ncbi:MAG: mechanosensitive ion channel domain-containing protein [Chloroflexota bacterium]
MDETVVLNDFQTIQDQIDVVLIYLSRGAVLYQLLAISVVIGLALLAAHFLDDLVDYGAARNREDDGDSFLSNRILPAIGMTFFPITGLVAMNMVMNTFAGRGILTGLIERSIGLLFILLVYSILLFVLYITIGERIMRPYQRRLLTPLVVVIILLAVVRDFIDFELLTTVTLVDRSGIAITIGSVIGAVITGYLFYVFTSLLPVTLESVILPRAKVSEGVAQSVTALVGYGIGLAGVILTLAILGLNLTALSFVAGGLSVGIGLGLQQIVSNFFSGLVMLFEQSVRPDDWVEIDGSLGIVQRVGIRSTIVRTFDNVDRIVPNENLMTGTVANYTTSQDYVVRQDITIGVSYEANPRQVSDLILKIAKQHEFILIDPAPNVFFIEYGDSSLNFWLVYYISHPRYLLTTKNDLLHDIFKAFEKHGIEIPYPQRDLNLRRGWEEVFGQGTDSADESESDHAQATPNISDSSA